MGDTTGHSLRRERNRGVKGIICLTTNNKFVEAEVKNGEEIMGDVAEKIAWGRVLKDPEYHIIETDFFLLAIENQTILIRAG